MRLGIIAAIVFITLSLGVLYGTVSNQNMLLVASGVGTEGTLIDEDLEAMMDATKVIQEGDWGNYITLLAAPFVYFDSVVSIAWKAFAYSPFTSDIAEGTGWAMVPYFTVTPLVIVLFFGLIILLIGTFWKTI